MTRQQKTAFPTGGDEATDRVDRALRGVLSGTGVVAAVTGASVAIRGVRAIPGGGSATASTDSVLRFYAVVWAAQGPRLWRLSREGALPWGELTEVCLTTFVGGLARLAAARQSGAPHRLFQVLTLAELGLPPVLLLLRSRQHSASGVSPLTGG